MFVIAHRGANKLAPQNTIHAFLKAAELKSDGVETDVHVTKDGELVLCHNGTVDKTSDGKGRISDMSLSDLKRFDFGSWFGRRFKNTTIPTLDEFLQTMKDTAVSVLNIELNRRRAASSTLWIRSFKRPRNTGLRINCLSPALITASSIKRRALSRASRRAISTPPWAISSSASSSRL